MTIKKAISQLKSTLLGFANEEGGNNIVICRLEPETCRIAIEALEKQIPQRPKQRHSTKFGDSYNDGECPICGAVYSDGLSDTPLYCSQCGQQFDWSDEE